MEKLCERDDEVAAIQQSWVNDSRGILWRHSCL